MKEVIMNKETILVISAHPDDEVLGLGGTISKYSSSNDIFLLILSDGESARHKEKNLDKISEREKNAKEAAKILGIKKVIFSRFEDQMLDSIPIKNICKSIEEVIAEFNPTIVFTHHKGDVNQDHRRCFEASMIAVRPTSDKSIKKIYTYSVLSSSEWSGPFQDSAFLPNTFVDIEGHLEKKILAMQKYSNELELFPHPRSVEMIKSEAKFWGSSVGLNAAESFFLVREIIK